MAAPFRIPLESATLVGERQSGADGSLPLVLVHGFGGSRHDWAPLLRALPAERSVITYDQRGFGDSEMAQAAPFSHADDLAALLDAFDIERADLCGMSLGGATALNFALNHPRRVRRLVLISPLMVGWSWTSEWVDRWKAIGRAARTGDMGQARQLWWHHPLFDSVRKTSAGQMLRDGIEAFSGEQWIQDYQRPALPDIDRLTTLAIPTLLLTGARDTEDFRLIAEVVANLGKDVTRVDYSEAGHMLNLEIPGLIAGEIDAFLSTGS